MNPLQLMQFKKYWDEFTSRHPKFPMFLNAVSQNGITEGTIIENDWKLSIRTKETAEFSDGFIKPKADDSDTSPIEKFINACIDGTGTPDGLDLDAAIALTQLLENAYISDKTNSTITL